jgi:hypothetical protein
MQRLTKRFSRWRENTAPVVIGTEAIKFFKESFANQGFTDESLEKCEEVGAHV